MCEKHQSFSMPSSGRTRPEDTSPASLSMLLSSRPLHSFVLEPLPYVYEENTSTMVLPPSTSPCSTSASHDDGDGDNLAFLFLDEPWPMRTHRSDLLAAVLDRSMEIAQQVVVPPVQVVEEVEHEQLRSLRRDEHQDLLLLPQLANCRISSGTVVPREEKYDKDAKR